MGLPDQRGGRAGRVHGLPKPHSTLLDRKYGLAERDREGSGQSKDSLLGPFYVLVQSELWEISSGLPHPERGWRVYVRSPPQGQGVLGPDGDFRAPGS